MVDSIASEKRSRDPNGENLDIPNKKHHDEEIDCERFNEELTKKKKLLEEAVKVLHNDTKNQILFEAFNLYHNVRKYRDELLIRIGELDNTFFEFILSQAEEDKKPVDLEEELL